MRAWRGDVYDTLLTYFESLPTPWLSFMGPACRTWFVDTATLRRIITDLASVRPYEVFSGCLGPFDTYVEDFATELGLNVVRVGDPDVEKRMAKGYTRPVELLQYVNLIVAFPKEDPAPLHRDDASIVKSKVPKRYGVETADPMMGEAIRMRIPVFGVYRDGTTRFEAWT